MRAIQRQKGVSRLLDENQRIRFDDAGVETTRIEPELPVKADVSRFAKDSGYILVLTLSFALAYSLLKIERFPHLQWLRFSH